MKTIRRLTTLAGLAVVVFALSATGARAQGPALTVTNFSGTFTLPFNAQWGRVALPAGEYSLYYGSNFGGTKYVEIVAKERGSLHVLLLAGAPIDVSPNAKNALVCVREGNIGIVRALEMPQIGEALRFRMPQGAMLVSHNGRHNGSTQIAEAPVLIQRITIAQNSN
jgi:hypothetical protein